MGSSRCCAQVHNVSHLQNSYLLQISLRSMVLIFPLDLRALYLYFPFSSWLYKSGARRLQKPEKLAGPVLLWSILDYMSSSMSIVTKSNSFHNNDMLCTGISAQLTMDHCGVCCKGKVHDQEYWKEVSALHASTALSKCPMLQ